MRAAGRSAGWRGPARPAQDGRDDAAADRRGEDQLEAVQATVEGLLLGSYRFDRYKTKADDADRRLGKEAVLGAGKADAKATRGAKEAIRRGEVIAESQMWARDLVNTPALDLPPAELAREAQVMARQVGLTCKVWTEAELKKAGSAACSAWVRAASGSRD